MRARVILVSIAAAAAAAIGAGCMAPLLEPLEPQLVFRPRALAGEHVKALAGTARVEEVRLATTDGLRLHGWLKRPERWTPGKPHRLVIVYGGVGQEVSEFVGLAHASADWGWLMINSRPDIDAANIVVLGRSLGSYVAIAVAAARKVRAAILATPFDSAAALGEEHYRLPLGWLVQSRYNPALMAPTVSAPALFLLAEKDEVTPVKNGLALARRWGGLVKTVLLPGAGHKGVENREEFWTSIGDFLAALDEGTATAAVGPSAEGSSTGRSSAH